MNRTPALPSTPVSLQVRTILMALAETCCLHGDKCVIQSDRDIHMQLVLRRRVWFQQGVPHRLRRRGFLALPTASEAINGNDSWAGSPGSSQPQRRGPPDSRSPGGALWPVLRVSEVREEAMKIVITMNT